MRLLAFPIALLLAGGLARAGEDAPELPRIPATSTPLLAQTPPSAVLDVRQNLAVDRQLINEAAHGDYPATMPIVGGTAPPAAAAPAAAPLTEDRIRQIVRSETQLAAADAGMVRSIVQETMRSMPMPSSQSPTQAALSPAAAPETDQVVERVRRAGPIRRGLGAIGRELDLLGRDKTVTYHPRTVTTVTRTVPAASAAPTAAASVAPSGQSLSSPAFSGFFRR